MLICCQIELGNALRAACYSDFEIRFFEYLGETVCRAWSLQVHFYKRVRYISRLLRLCPVPVRERVAGAPCSD